MPTPYQWLNFHSRLKCQAVVETLNGGVSWKFAKRSRQLVVAPSHVGWFHDYPDNCTVGRMRRRYWRARLIKRGRVIDDHALGFYSVRSENRIPAFLQNFNPRPRRVARIIRGYIDQSMLAPTESRTILPRWGMRATWKRADDTTATALTTWRLRAEGVPHRFLVGVKKKTNHLESPRSLSCGLDKHHGSRHLWDISQRVRHDCESSRVRDRRYESGFSCLKRDRRWRSDRSGLSNFRVRNLGSNDDQLRMRESTIVIIFNDDYWRWKWVDPAGNARRTGDLGKWRTLLVTRDSCRMSQTHMVEWRQWNTYYVE